MGRGEGGTGRGRNRGLQGEGTGEAGERAGGLVVGRGGPKILNMGIQKLTTVIFLTALILVLGMYN